MNGSGKAINSTTSYRFIFQNPSKRKEIRSYDRTNYFIKSFLNFYTQN